MRLRLFDSSARPKLSSLKQAAKVKLQLGDGRAMLTRRAAREVIDLTNETDQDEELPPPHRRRPSRLSPLAYRSRTSLRHGSESLPATDGDSSDSLAPAHAKHHVVTPQRSTQHDRLTLESDTTSGDSSDYSEAANALRTTIKAAEVSSKRIPSKGHNHATKPQRLSNTLQAPIRAQSTTIAKQVQLQPLEASACPYYDDPKFDVKMYRGPGYEQFPVVLGTVAGHKEICDRWDARTVRRSEHFAINSDKLLSNTSVSDVERADQCLIEVLEIFPNIEHKFVRELHQKAQLERPQAERPPSNPSPCSNMHVAEIAEMVTYPRQKVLKRKLSPPVSDDTGVTIKWNKEVLKDSAYLRDAIILLATEFAHIPTHYISSVVNQQQSLFDSFNHLTDLENKHDFRAGAKNAYRRLKLRRTNLERKYQKEPSQRRDGQIWVSLINELQAARQHQARELCRSKRQKILEEKEADNLALHIAQKAMVECRCCFDDKPINRTVTCEGDDMHFFCNDCVKRQAENQIGSMKFEMLCVDTGGCKARLSDERVAQALPLQLYDKLAYNQQQAEVSQAGIEGLESCPFCEFKAICDSIEFDSVFDCQNPECAVNSCRKCKEKAHLPKTCEEVRKARGLDARHRVEEARSEAMMRTCPKCKVKIIKEYGCNKMVCMNCRTVMCYVCQMDISGTGRADGYSHFHRSGAKCTLHDASEVDRHQQEADEAEKATIAKVKAEYDDIDEEALQIETGKQAKALKKMSVPKVAPPPQPGFGFGRLVNVLPIGGYPHEPQLPQHWAQPMAGFGNLQRPQFFENRYPGEQAPLLAIHGPDLHQDPNELIQDYMQPDFEQFGQLVGQAPGPADMLPVWAPDNQQGEQRRLNDLQQAHAAAVAAVQQQRAAQAQGRAHAEALQERATQYHDRANAWIQQQRADYYQ